MVGNNELAQLHTNQRLFIMEMQSRGIDVEIIYKEMELIKAEYGKHIEWILDRDSSIIKLCEVCGVGNEYVEDRTYNTNYMDYARVSEILERIGNRDDCIFHFYAE